MSCILKKIDEAISTTIKSDSKAKEKILKDLDKLKAIEIIKGYKTAVSKAVINTGISVDEATANAIDADEYYKHLLEVATAKSKETDIAYDKAKSSLTYQRDAKVTNRVKGDRKEGKGVRDRAESKAKELNAQIEEIQSHNMNFFNKMPNATNAEKQYYKDSIEANKLKIESLDIKAKAYTARADAASVNLATTEELFKVAEELASASEEAYATAKEHKLTYSTAGQVLMAGKIAGKKNKTASPHIDALSLADYFEASTVSIDLLNMDASLDLAMSTTEGTKSTTQRNVSKVRSWADKLQNSISEFVSTLDPVMTNEVSKGGNNVGYQNLIRLGTTQVQTGDFKNQTTTTLDPIINKAATLAFIEWAANIGGAAIVSKRSNEDALRMVGKDKDDVLSTSEREMLNNFDGVVPDTARLIGSSAMQMLGLKAKEGTTELETAQFKAKLEVEIGLLALKGAAQEGIITLNDKKLSNVPADIKPKLDRGEFVKGYAVKTTAIYGDNATYGGTTATFSFTSPDSELINGAESAVKDTLDALGDTKRTTGLHLSAESATPARGTIVNQGVSAKVGDVPEVQKDAVIKQSETENWFDDGYLDVLDNVIKESGKEALLRMLGTSNAEEAYIEDRPAVIGKNNAIARSLKHLQDARKTLKDAGQTDMWFKWYVVTNGRFGIKSNTFNIQDQKLHRNAVSNASITIDTEQKEAFLKLSMAQGFDISVDKLTIEAALDKFNSYAEKLQPFVDAINDKEEGAYTVALKFVTSKTSEPEHAMRALSEYIAYSNWMAGGRKSELKSGMTLETDAITSGYILKILQMPIFTKEDGTIDLEKVKEQLEKGGIFDYKVDSKGKMLNPTYGVWKMDKSKDDSYETAGKAFGEELKKASQKENMVYRLGSKVNPKTPFKEVSTKQQKQLEKIAVESSINTQAIMALLGEGKVVDNIIEISRAFMKNPFMIFNYGSAISSIVKSQARKTTDNIYSRMSVISKKQVGKDANPDINEAAELAIDEITNAIKASEYQLSKLLNSDKKATKTLIDNQLRDLHEVFNSTSPQELLTFKLDKDLLKAIESTAENVINKPLTATFQSEYSEFMEAGRAINASMVAMARIALNALDKKILEEVAKKNKDNTGRDVPLSHKEIDALILSMRDKFPVLNMPLGDGDASKILLMKTAQGEYTHGHEYNVEATSGFKDFKAQSSMYKLVESFTSGAVIPIHFMDGSIQSRVLSMFTAIGVHDANLFNVANAIEGTKEYNKAVIELAKSYSLVTEVLSSFNESLSDATRGDLVEIDAKYMEEFLRKAVIDSGINSSDAKYIGTTKLNKAIDYLKDVTGLDPILMETVAISRVPEDIRPILRAMVDSLQDNGPVTLQKTYNTIKKLQETSEEGRYQLFNNSKQYIEHSALEGAGFITKAEEYTKKVVKTELVGVAKDYFKGESSQITMVSKEAKDTISPLDNTAKTGDNTSNKLVEEDYLTQDEYQSVLDDVSEYSKKKCK